MARSVRLAALLRRHAIVGAGRTCASTGRSEHRLWERVLSLFIVVVVNEYVIPLAGIMEAGEDTMDVRNPEAAERTLPNVTLTRVNCSAEVTAYGAQSSFLTLSVTLKPTCFEGGRRVSCLA